MQAVSFVSKFVGMFNVALEEKVQELSKSLEEDSNMWKHQKTLFIDIDETLLTRTNCPIPGSETLMVGNIEVNSL